MSPPASAEAFRTASERIILVIEDDREIARAVSLRLARAGYTPVLARDGREGLAIAEACQPDAIILDLRMPVMDGFTFLAQLLGTERTTAIPTIILTADAGERARIRALDGGASYFVEKPYRARDLIIALDAAPGGEAGTRTRGARNDSSNS
jgi:DNA-binding response OmpR family regulator